MSSMTGSRSAYGASGSNRKEKVGGYNIERVSKYSPELLETARRLHGKATPGYEQAIERTGRIAGGSDEDWEALEAPALRQFGQLQGSTASRFSGGSIEGASGGSGALSARHGSGFQNELTSGAVELAEKLQSKRMDYQRQATQDLRGIYNDLMEQQETTPYFQEPKQSGWKKWLGASLPIIGGITGGVLGGPKGAEIGARAGSAAGQYF